MENLKFRNILDLSIIIVNWNVKEYLKNCLESIRNNVKEITYEVIVVDNNSTDNSIPMIEGEFSEVILIKNKTNLGFAKANNQAIKKAGGKYILLLNPDTFVLGNSLKEMVRFMDLNSQAGVCGCRLVNPDNPDAPLRTGWLKFPSLIDELMVDTFLGGLTSMILSKFFGRQKKISELHSSSLPIEVDWISGSSLMARIEAVKKAGLMDEEFFLYAEDMEWCYRIKSLYNWKIYLLPSVKIIHYGGSSSKKLGMIECTIHWCKSRYRFHQKFSNNILFSFIKLIKIFLFNISMGKWIFLYLVDSQRRKYAQEKIQLYTSLLRVTFKL